MDMKLPASAIVGTELSDARERLTDILARYERGEDVAGHPQYEELLKLLDQEEEAKRQGERFASRMQADEAVSFSEAANMRRIGRLVNESADTMLLHTKEAYRLFIGRGQDPARNQPAIMGGKRAAACLRAIWGLSGNDNPYADWQLLQASERLDAVLRQLREDAKRAAGQLEALRQKGLSYSVLRSEEPQPVGLGFASPYGYLIAEITVEYDYLIRVIKTLIRKNLSSDAEGRKQVVDGTRRVRAVFHEIVRVERLLANENMKPLSRADFLPGADDLAKKRVSAATQLFGEIPRDVFAGHNRPRHSRRKAGITPEEQRLLDTLDLTPSEADLALEAHLI